MISLHHKMSNHQYLVFSLESFSYCLSFLSTGLTNISLSLIGIIHGLTNLGGGFLIIHANKLTNNKIKTRYYR